MNSILLRLQKNRFFLLIPIVLVLTFSLSYLTRTILIIFLNPTPGSIIKNDRNLITASNQIVRPLNSYEEMIKGNLIRGVDPSEIEGATGPDGKKVGGSSRGQPVTMIDEIPGTDDLMVTGTVSGSLSFARVGIKRKEKEEAEVYKTNEKIGNFNYVIKYIGNDYAVLAKPGGIALKVEVGETIGDAKKKVIEKVSPTTLASNEKPIPKIVSRTDFNKVMANPETIYKGARFGPNLTPEGKIDGYKIYSVEKTHVFAMLGAQNGDIVKRINGMPLEKTEKMLEMWNAIKEAQKISVDLDRKGKIFTYEFTIRN